MAFSGQGALGGAAAGASAGAAAGPWGAAIGGVLGALGGGFLGGKKKTGMGPESMINWNYNNYVTQVKALKDASRRFGFHPLALMGNSGVGGAQVAPVGGQSSGGDWASDAIQNAIGAGSELYQQDVDADRYDDERFEHILREQNAIGEQSRRDAADDEYRKAMIDEVRSRTMLNQARMSAIGAARPMGTDAGRLTDAFGVALEPSNTGAQEYADQYGDILSEGYGITNWMKDMFTDPSTGEGLARKFIREKVVPVLPRRNPYMR